MTYHTLLIALDRYPLGYRSLYGCVNDIDGLEELLLGEAGRWASPLFRRLQIAVHPGDRLLSDVDRLGRAGKTPPVACAGDAY